MLQVTKNKFSHCANLGPFTYVTSPCTSVVRNLVLKLKYRVQHGFCSKKLVRGKISEILPGNFRGLFSSEANQNLSS